ncbi:MAG: EamA family transporter [Kordiimonas sp.]
MSPDIIATLLILSSAFLHASWNALVKHAPDKYATVIFATSYCGIMFVPFAFFVEFPTSTMWAWIASSVAVRLTYQWLAVKSLETNPLTVAYPLSRGMGPLLVTLFAVFILHETLPLTSYLGISILILGILFTLSFKGAEPAPSRSALIYPILAGSFIAFYTIVDSRAVINTGDPYAYIVWSGIAFAPATLLAGIMQRGPRMVTECLSTWRLGLPVAVISNMAYALVLLAYSLGSIAEIAALRETSIVFASLIGFFWLKEKISKNKLVSICLIAIGALILKL